MDTAGSTGTLSEATGIGLTYKVYLSDEFGASCLCGSWNCTGCPIADNDTFVRFPHNFTIAVGWPDQCPMAVSCHPSLATVPIAPPDLTLTACLRAFSHPEQLDVDWSCPGCHVPRRAAKTMEVQRLPPVLVVHLKRFATTGAMREKIDCLVSFPEEIDMAPYCVDLSTQPDRPDVGAVPAPATTDIDTGAPCADVVGTTDSAAGAGGATAAAAAAGVGGKDAIGASADSGVAGSSSAAEGPSGPASMVLDGGSALTQATVADETIESKHGDSSGGSGIGGQGPRQHDHEHVHDIHVQTQDHSIDPSQPCSPLLPPHDNALSPPAALPAAPLPSGAPPSTVYRLVAVTNHFGSLYGGHYTAFARRYGAWYEFDDSRVSSLDPARVPSANAYVLIYERIDFADNATPMVAAAAGGPAGSHAPMDVGSWAGASGVMADDDLSAWANNGGSSTEARVHAPLSSSSPSPTAVARVTEAMASAIAAAAVAAGTTGSKEWTGWYGGGADDSAAAAGWNGGASTSGGLGGRDGAVPTGPTADSDSESDSSSSYILPRQASGSYDYADGEVP